MKKDLKPVIDESVAIKEVIDFIGHWKKKSLKEDLIKEEYPDVLEAVKDGFLTFDDKKKPVLKLREPIKTDEGNIHLETVSFRTRIKPTAKAELMDGLKMQTQQGKYTLRVISYMIQEPINILDKFDSEDYDAISQICVVFQ